jgi:hypothetical protein
MISPFLFLLNNILFSLFLAPDEVPDICGFLGDKLNSVDNDPDLGPYDDVRNYMYEGEGNSVGSLSSLASG